jgi:hypothetical protein
LPRENHHQEDLNKALNIGLFALAGAIVPVVGVVLAIVAERLANSVPTTAATAGKKGTIKTLSVLCLRFVHRLRHFVLQLLQQPVKESLQSKHNRSGMQKHKQITVPQAEALAKQYKYDACVARAGEAYTQYLELNFQRTTTNAAGEKIYYMPQPQWDYVEQKRTNEQAACLNEKLQLTMIGLL